MASEVISPHGGTLKNLVVDAQRAKDLKSAARDWRSIDLTPRQIINLELLLCGGFSPLEGFMIRADADSVRASQTLKDGTFWPTPITLDVSDDVAASLTVGKSAALRDEEGVILAALKVEEIWKPDGADFHSVGGKLQGLQLPVHYDFKALRKTPAELRAAYAERGWSRVVAFPAAGPIHRGVQAATLLIAEVQNAGLLIFPASADDPKHYTHVRCHQAVVPEYPEGSALLTVLPLAHRDPALRAIVARNYGCSHLILDPAPADLPKTGVTALPLGDLPAENEPFAAVTEELRRRTPERHEQGVTIFFSGLPSSGKSTVANALRVRIMEGGKRDVSLIDGDVARRNLSKGLGFSKEDRDTNIRRIGWVASEIARHGGTAICCPIAPYDLTRKEVRAMTEKAGGAFILVHISTPVEICEKRDRKGLYAKARAGQLKEFTGVSDPYEVPKDAEISVDTANLTIEDAAEKVLGYLKKQGFL